MLKKEYNDEKCLSKLIGHLIAVRHIRQNSISWKSLERTPKKFAKVVTIGWKCVNKWEKYVRNTTTNCTNDAESNVKMRPRKHATRAHTDSYRSSTLKIVYRYLLACICEWNTEIILFYSIFDFDGVNMRHYKQPPPTPPLSLSLSLSIVRLPPARTLVRPDYHVIRVAPKHEHTHLLHVNTVNIYSKRISTVIHNSHW